MSDYSKSLWEWLDTGKGERPCRIYRFGEIGNGGGFIIGGLVKSQAQQLVEHHNEAIERMRERKLK